ncbi:MAG: hypothetical protein R3F19_19960 [Verrucomicrobiales bacterium]
MLLGSGAGGWVNVSAQDFDSGVALTIRHAVEVEFQSVPGQVYQVQSSADNENWHPVGDSYFGDGAKVVDLISYGQTGERSKFFRVRTMDASEVGIGPVALAGATYLLNDGGVLRTIQFDNAATGTVVLGDEGLREFRYGFLKTGPSAGRLQMVFGKNATETVSMSFSTDSAGTFQCERFDDGALVEKDAGTFSRVYLGDDVRLTFDTATPAPQSPIGYSIVLFAGEQSNVVRVLNDVVVKESMLNTSASYVYDYTVSAEGKGQLTVWKGREKYDHYEFGFTSVGTGEFRRSQYAGGALVDADVGVFSVFGAPAQSLRLGNDGQAIPMDAEGGLVHFPETPESPVGGDAPPAGEGQCKMPGTLEGICVDVSANGKGEKLCFYSEDSGSLVKNLVSTSAFVPFEYSYEAISETVSRIEIQFATADGEQRIVYELNLDDGCNGSYSRTKYVGDRVTAEDTGRFSMSAELIVPAGGVVDAGIIADPNSIGVAAEVVRRTVLGN